MKTNELKCTDLRIGNLIDYFGDIIKVDVIDCFDGKEKVCGETKDGRPVYDKLTYFEPIELTEEVLEKIGFKKNIIYGSVIEYFPIDDNLASIFCTKEKQNIRIQVVRENTSETITKYIKYLHELQNAYYLLTNEELEVEL